MSGVAAMPSGLEPDLAEIDAGAELRFDRLRAAARRDLDHVAARVLAQPVESEVAVIVARGFRHDAAVLHQPHARAFDAIDESAGLGRDRAADEARRVAPQVAIVHARFRAELGPENLEALVARHGGHRVVLDPDGA